ncbi:L-fucose/L-arabinose isomerase family protein [Pontivivens ytuae]|uniref:L-fucose isomerase C-terminal domain-containing protein n=1 Tax=Pontivivens ytuae TaxID=2789856 RepID=A0A7S9LPV6_9RHOB|nr:hypothetical protein [Pontivivens ytuae]QPH53099.1 hypothetical protein I0K15_15010 [Pontivivens ytuae]
MARIGILPLGRPTFDVPFAEEKLVGMLAALDATGHEVVGPRALLFDAEATMAALDDLAAASIDQFLILQVTFTDASMTVAAANRFADVPLSIWAVPEPRLGGRLRLNAFCGLNLASHALGLNDRAFGWLYAEPDGAGLDDLLAGQRASGRLKAQPVPATASPTAEALKGRRIGRIGAHPDGFDTCAYDAEALRGLTGVEVEALELDTLFDTARAVDDTAATALRAEADARLDGLAEVDQTELDRSLRLKLALDQLRTDRKFDAFAIRCWPETFTEYGGAVCGPVSMLGEARVPCACEADVYGAVTQMMLQEAADAPVFLVDLVDMDSADNTGVVWHCGQAPASMAAAHPTATIHTNRKMPLLYEFALKPGRVTFVRLSQAHGETKLILSGGEVLDRPMAFTGTSGVVRFDRPADETLANVIDSGLEHHMALAYGDHRAALIEMAGALGLPVLEI